MYQTKFRGAASEKIPASHLVFRTTTEDQTGRATTKKAGERKTNRLTVTLRAPVSLSIPGPGSARRQNSDIRNYPDTLSER